jgi:hypothetical protein
LQIEQTVQFLKEFDISTQQPVLPSGPEDPTAYPGKLPNVYEVALELLEEVPTSDKYELLAKLQVKLVLALMVAGHAPRLDNPYQFTDPEESSFSSMTIRSANRLIEAARDTVTMRAAEEKRSLWNAKVNSPEFQSSPEVRRYHELKAAWESECQKIQLTWSSDQAARTNQWNIKRDAMIAFVQSLKARSEKVLAIKKREDSVGSVLRIEALTQACEPTEGRPLCLIPSLDAIQNSIDDGKPKVNLNSNPDGN